MIINMKPDATDKEIDHVIDRIRECGYQEHVIRGAERTVIGAVGNNSLGVVGVNWNVKIMACKFMGASGVGTVADAID